MTNPELTAMDMARYDMGYLARRVEETHSQELCRIVAYALEPAVTAYRIVPDDGLSGLPDPEVIWDSGTLPRHAPPPCH